MRKQLLPVTVAGFAYGALLYGGVLAWVHLLHNRDLGVVDALVAQPLFWLLYGIGGALAALAGHLVVWAARSLPGRAGRIARGWTGLPLPGFGLGVTLFNLAFWELYFLYGLTYDQVPWGRPEGVAGMVFFLVVGVVLLGAVVIAVSLPLAALLRRVAYSLWPPGRFLGFALAGSLAVGCAIALATGLPPRPPAAADAPQPDIGQQGDRVQVALVGLDGADWQVIDPLVAAGELPAFAALMEDGAHGPLATIPGANSAVIWASIYSGKRPAVHNIHDFYRIEPLGTRPGLFPVHRTVFKELAGPLERIGLARRVTVSRYNLRAQPIWEIVNNLELSIGVVDGYYFSFPALVPTTRDGFFVAYGADALAGDLAAGAVTPAEAGLFAQPRELLEEIAGQLDQEDFYWQEDALFDLLDRHPQPDLLNFYTHQPDSYQHWFWKWYQPRYYPGVDPAELAEKKDRIPALYRDFDAFLARLRARLGPDTVLIVASDHGHAPTILHRDYHTQHRHGPPGIALLAGGPVRPGFELAGADIYDLFPTVLYLMGLPVPEDAAGRVLTEAIDPAWLERNPIRTLPTYEGLWPDRFAGGGPRDRALNRREIEKLRALGYL